ncbi:hypothetical protein Pcinc_011147 [Petrolisthes cinctipes]|uniref:Uncharacterized protein n=1 Tax=Petrolisthes cinctipes TaxID=88211 RepID=A0AAE1G3B9_PETCI|nr:hypothetical protein Pcinc_011147 [Petrolisthes cinctipes]
MKTVLLNGGIVSATLRRLVGKLHCKCKGHDRDDPPDHHLLSPQSETVCCHIVGGLTDFFRILGHQYYKVYGKVAMRKLPRPQTFNFIKKGAAVLLAVEVGIFGGIYYVYHRMNTDRDYRYYMSRNYSSALEVFYSVGEYFNTKDQTRQLDQRVWTAEYPEKSSEQAADRS